MKPDDDLEHPKETLNPASSSAFPRIFTVGVIGWLAGSFITFGLSWLIIHPDNVATAVLWTISHWVLAFAFGLLLMIVFAMATRASGGLAIRAYVLPMALLAAIAWLCQRIYPDSAFRGDLFTYLPVVLVFYIFGCLWMAINREKEEAPAFARAVIPGILGGLVILGFVAIPVFISNAFIYRNAFQFKISKMSLQDAKLTGEGSLAITKPGNYNFVAPRYYCDELEMLDETEPGIEIGEITWGEAGEPKAGMLGVFPFKIAWRKNMLPPQMVETPYSSDSVYMEVRNPDTENELIYSLSTPVQRP